MEEALVDSKLKAVQEAENFAWNARTVPNVYDPVQLKTKAWSLTCSWLDWWDTRANFLSCCVPVMNCVSCVKGDETWTVVEADDPEPWKEQLRYANPDTPDHMQGVWWLKDNVAHEKLVTNFSDAEFIGSFNEKGDDGYGRWTRNLNDNWSRDRSLFGAALLVLWGGGQVKGFMNMKDGICTVGDPDGSQGRQIVYRINDDEWWKVHYAGNPGEDGDQDIKYMYKWLKVIDKDGKETKHWKEWVEWTKAPLPNKGLPCFMSMEDKLENMVYPNKVQLVRFKRPLVNGKFA